MFGAASAREKTERGIMQLAEKFLDDTVEDWITEATSRGCFKTTISLENVENAKVVGTAVAKKLNSIGYEAEYACREGARCEPLLTISWEY